MHESNSIVDKQLWLIRQEPRQLEICLSRKGAVHICCGKRSMSWHHHLVPRLHMPVHNRHHNATKNHAWIRMQTCTQLLDWVRVTLVLMDGFRGSVSHGSSALHQSLWLYTGQRDLLSCDTHRTFRTHHGGWEGRRHESGCDINDTGVEQRETARADIWQNRWPMTALHWLLYLRAMSKAVTTNTFRWISKRKPCGKMLCFKVVCFTICTCMQAHTTTQTCDSLTKYNSQKG